MFNTKKNLRRSPKHKQQKNNKKTSQYEEDYNEVILNDLMDNNNDKKEVEVQEEPRGTKKKKGFSFGKMVPIGRQQILVRKNQKIMAIISGGEIPLGISERIISGSQATDRI